MPSIKVVPKGDSSRVGYDQISAAFGPGAPGHPAGRPRRAAEAAATAAVLRGRPRHRRGDAGRCPAAASLVADRGDADRRPLDRPRRRRPIDRLRAELPAGALVGGPAAENHDLEAALAAKTPLAIGVVLGARLPAAAGRLPGAADRRDRRARQPALDRRRLRRRQADLPGRPPRRPARLRIAGLPRRLGADLLLRDDLRDRDGLHRLPALLGARALGSRPATRKRGDGRRPRPLRPRDPRRRRGDGRGLLHLRPLRPAAAEGDGDDPRRSPSCSTPSWSGCCCCRCSCGSAGNAAW